MIFDWISPLLAIGNDITHGGGHTFLIPTDCGWTGREIEGRLRNNGIETWGLMCINDTFTISVRREQAEKAGRVLQRAGIVYYVHLGAVTTDLLASYVAEGIIPGGLYENAVAHVGD